MCGIVGTYNIKNVSVEKMIDRIRHRGRDGEGIFQHGAVLHGHVRLSILDTSSRADQPFRIGNHTITFNGEIWNYKDLKEELIAKGHEFVTKSDTEVLLRHLMEYGIDRLDKVEGMFAFCWSSQDYHYLVRDRFGEIPLYLAKYKDGFIWASERKAFPSGCQPIAVSPGFAFNLTKSEWIKWYSIPSHYSFSESFVKDSIEKGVNHRLQSDVPVCCLISGGLDSSLILSLAQKNKKDIIAYTAKFSENSEDLMSARRICSELDVTLVEVPVDISVDRILDAIHTIEIASKAQVEIASLCLPLAERIAIDGFKVCLSGEAADELFGGYGNFCIQASNVADDEIHKLRKKLLDKMSRGNFIRCNKAFMRYGVECRLPFMDLGLVETCVNANKSQSPLNKKLLKRLASSNVPDWIVKRKKDTFQGGAGVSKWTEKNIHSPIRYYNNELKKQFGYLPSC